VRGIGGVDDDLALVQKAPAQLGSQLHHLRREGADGADKGIGSCRLMQHHGLRGRAGHDQRAVPGGFLQVVGDARMQTQVAGLVCKPLRAAGAARVNPDLLRAKALGKSLQMGAALHAGADDEQRALGLGARRRAASSDTAAVRLAVTVGPSRIS
jgi:hypothetical protein